MTAIPSDEPHIAMKDAWESEQDRMEAFAEQCTRNWNRSVHPPPEPPVWTRAEWKPAMYKSTRIDELERKEHESSRAQERIDQLEHESSHKRAKIEEPPSADGLGSPARFKLANPFHQAAAELIFTI